MSLSCGAFAQLKQAALPDPALQLKAKAEAAIATQAGDMLRALSGSPKSLG